MSPVIDGHLAQITVPLADGESVSFDGVTASLHVNDAGAAPLLCVSGVHDIASGDLSLPGVIMASEPH